MSINIWLIQLIEKSLIYTINNMSKSIETLSTFASSTLVTKTPDVKKTYKIINLI